MNKGKEEERKKEERKKEKLNPNLNTYSGHVCTYNKQRGNKLNVSFC